MTENGLLEYILVRLGCSDTAEEVFGADETEDWPTGALDALTNAGLLRRAQPAQVIECRGCEENCVMPVHITPAEGSRPARAFISCDKRDDVGRRLSVDMRRLERWHITGGQLAKALARLLGFTQLPEEDAAGKRWKLGRLEGNQGQELITLAVEKDVFLLIADHNVPLAEVLILDEQAIRLDGIS